MGLTPAGLRAWIAVIAGLLVVAIAGFFLYDRWQGRRFGHDVPNGLGTSVQQSTVGFTYSESRGGHTIYTLHASKAVQYESDGHLDLHDVSITLYGTQGAPSNRIYGSEFDWDPVHGIAHAIRKGGPKYHAPSNAYVVGVTHNRTSRLAVRTSRRGSRSGREGWRARRRC